MNPHRPSEEELFEAARLLADPAERAAYLDRQCAGNFALRAEVESLLAAHDKAGTFIDQPIGGQETIQLNAADLPLSEQGGERIGRYKLLEKIGEGGFGDVWMAEQEEPVRRRVALKIIKLGMDTREVVARFEAERQALALMDHPNIARVFDGGATETGRPYFVMELVRGEPITAYCDAQRLKVDERLELFMQVCQAVQHAHQKGIIHRDLKPSNVLVTVVDDRAVPKVIDFGIAKATAHRLTEKTLFTRFQQFIGTPTYMSPEQTGGNREDIDTRSDIYSLGVLLYELLTGKPPFDTKKLLEAGYEAILKTIREDEPPKPSTRLSTLAEKELGTVAAQRGAEPAKLRRLVRGDLDWIVMKTLEKDRQRRYETAASLARDIERHLQAEPVSAAAPGLFYRAGKFVRRNRTRLAFAALVLVAMALALIGGKYALNYQSSRRALESAGTNAVFNAAKSGTAQALRRLLDANPPLVGQRDASGWTPLSYAADAGNAGTLRLLLARGAAVEVTNRLGLTPLLNAATKNRTAAVAALLEAGANPNHADNSGITALQVASHLGATEMGRLLLAKGAQVDAVCLPFRITALHGAALLGHADFVELLLAHGARTDQKDENGFTPLHKAAAGLSGADTIRRWNDLLYDAAAHGGRGLAPATEAISNQLAQYASAMPASFMAGGGEHRRVAELLIASKADLEATNATGCTPLLTAALSTNRPVAEVLVAHKANLNAPELRGLTPLAAAALKGGEELVSLLLEAGANPDLADSEGFTPLNTAVEHGHGAVVKTLLAHKANPNLARPNGQTPLHTAAGRGDIESVRLLLDHGAALHPLSRSGTPLAEAVIYRREAAVHFLLRRGAKPDAAATQSGMTALHWAAVLGQSRIARLLLESGATVDANSSWVGTSLHPAAAGRQAAAEWLATAHVQLPQHAKHYFPTPGSDENYEAVLRALLGAKANVNAREPQYERTPLITAVKYGHFAAVDILLEAGADLQAVDRVGRTPLHTAAEMDAPALVVSNIVARLLKEGASVEARDRQRGTPLHVAANNGKPVLVQLLLDAGALVNAKGPNLCTPLQLVVMRGNSEVVKLLLSKKPDLEWHDAKGTTALHQAAVGQTKDVLALLLEHGADANAGSSDASTALMILSEAGNLSMMKLLIEHGAKVNSANQSGWTAFLGAAKTGQIEVAELLLEYEADSHVVDKYGRSALIIAAETGRLKMVKFLLERGAQLQARNNDGSTALHQAADLGHADVVEFLLSRGMDANSRTKEQFTPLHRAANGFFTNEIHYVAVAKVLLAHGANVNARARLNQTTLHRAADWGRPQILQTLLAAGADPTARDDNGKTALDLAADTADRRLRPGVAAGRRECAELLRKASPKPN